MSDQPEALRLADALEQQAAWEARYGPSELGELLPESATLLRRQHAEIEALKAERDALRTDAERWKGLFAEALDAFNSRRPTDIEWSAMRDMAREARAAIAKVEGGNDE
jgi:hypothetical protein